MTIRRKNRKAILNSSRAAAANSNDPNAHAPPRAVWNLGFEIWDFLACASYALYG